MIETWTTAMVSALTGLHVRRLERLAAEKVLRPAVVRRGRRRFLLWRWPDLVEARALAALAAAGASGRAMRGAVRALRERDPDRPLSSYRLKVARGDVVELETAPEGEVAWSLYRRRGQGLFVGLGWLETELRERLTAGVAELPRQDVAVKPRRKQATRRG